MRDIKQWGATITGSVLIYLIYKLGAGACPYEDSEKLSTMLFSLYLGFFFLSWIFSSDNSFYEDSCPTVVFFNPFIKPYCVIKRKKFRVPKTKDVVFRFIPTKYKVVKRDGCYYLVEYSILGSRDISYSANIEHFYQGINSREETKDKEVEEYTLEEFDNYYWASKEDKDG